MLSFLLYLFQTISLQQRNFKQKIVALLKRFKVSEELEGESGHRGTAALRGERDLDALFQELESLSCCEGDDSGPDMDSISVGSTPKPSLRPFFTNSRIMLHDSITGNGGGGGGGDLGQLGGGGTGIGTTGEWGAKAGGPLDVGRAGCIALMYS